MEQSKIDSLTGLYYNHAFLGKADEFLKQVEPNTYCMLAIDLEHFPLFNKIYGRERGDKLLQKLAELLKEYQKRIGGIIGYMGGDNFAMLLKYNQVELEQLSRDISSEMMAWSNTVGFLPVFGIYPIADTGLLAATMYDRATIALGQVIGNYVKRSCEYSPDMEETVEKELCLLSEIQEALYNEEFTFYVQPQCDISTGKIVGGESLVRWQHPEKGLISPGVFVPILEKNGFIASLDRYVWKKVCQWLRSWIDRGHHPVPVSINVSRIDMFSMDVPAYLTELLETYNLPSNLLKVEITESAYAESNDKIIRTVKQLRDAKLLVMMDDFGSGYSSLNMLKSVSVDVLKLDMRFLDISDEEEKKGIGILESVVNMARQIRMPVIVEGVETQTQENYLLKMGCRYTQGYYYYRPMAIEDFEKLIRDERKLDFDGIWYKQVESLHVREFLDENLFSDAMLNNILGPAAFYDLYENNIDITRVNEPYYRLADISGKDAALRNKRFWIHVRDDDRQLLFTIFAQAYENPTIGASGYIHFVRTDGEILWVQLRVYFLQEHEGHKLFYGMLTDLTDLYGNKKPEDYLLEQSAELTENQQKHLKKYYGSLPCGCAVIKLLLDAQGEPYDYEIVYANQEIGKIGGGSMERLRFVADKALGDKQEELLKKAYRAAYYGEKVEYSIYSPLSFRYLRFVFGQYQYGYVTCILHDETHEHIYERSMRNILHAYREVHYIHLQDNYVRMLYPDDHHLLERGNYEETLNRHLGMGRILNYDEENIRRFLSLENLRQALTTQDSVEYKYQRRINGEGVEWCQTSVIVCERVNGVPKTAVMTIRSIEGLMREQGDKRYQSMSKMLGNMSEGFVIYQATGDGRLIHINPTILKLYGYTEMKEFEEEVGTTFKDMVHPEDRNRVNWEIMEQLKQSDRKIGLVRFRIIRKDGEVRWLDSCGHLENFGVESALYYMFLSDITEEITEYQKTKLLEMSKRYS